MDDELTEADKAKLKSIVAFQKVAFSIVLRWAWLFAVVFAVLMSAFSFYLWMRGSKSVKRYEATTTLIFSPKKIARIDALGDKQLMTILERPSLRRRVADRVEMDDLERMCLTSDLKVAQGKRQGNLFILTAASKTRKGAFAKVNAFADILIEEYVAYRSKDLDNWRKSLEERRKELVGRLSDIDAEMASFKARTGALAPNEALVALNALISDQRRNDSALGVDAANEEIKRRKLETSVGKRGPVVIANAQAIRRRVDAISAIDAELVNLREKYTDINPKISGKIKERAERVADLKKFLKDKGASGLDLDQIDHVEKAAGELADCITRLEAIAEKRAALAREIADNEKRAASLASIVMDYERIVTRREDVNTSVRELDEQLGGISYAVGALSNDLRQIERTSGADDNGPFGAKKAVVAAGAAFVAAGGLLFAILVWELAFGKVYGGREIAMYDGISFIGSLPEKGAMPADEEREAMGVISLKTLLAAEGAKTIFVCKLPGADPNPKFSTAMDYTASMSGTQCFLLDIVSHDGFVPPEGAEEMIGVVRKAQHGWFPAANRFALAPTELQLLKADIATICETFDNVFIRIEGVVRVGGTFFDQLLELSGAVLLLVGEGRTPRRDFAFARRHLMSSGKRVMAIATGAGARRVKADMEVMS